MGGMLFSKILSMSIIGCYTTLFIFIIRLLLKKAGRKYCYYLWLVVFLNLSIPFSAFSSFSLIPERVAELSADREHPIVQEKEQSNSDTEFLIYTDSGFQAAEDSLVNIIQPDNTIKKESVNRRDILMLAEKLWISGICLLCIYSIYSFFRLKYFLKNYQEGPLEENDRVVKVRNLTTPFLWGIFPPTIYLPSDIDGEEVKYILAHERCHLRRKDHLIKLWIYLTVVVHWFNPFAWLAYSFCVRDMEISCDEAVLACSEENIKKAYAGSLLKYAAKQNGYLLKPLTFGEPSIRSRIQNVLNYHKKSTIFSVMAFVCTCIVAAGLMLRPAEKENKLSEPTETALEASLVSGNGSPVIRIGNRICYMFGKPLYSDGAALYATQEEAENKVVRRYGLEDGSFTWVADGTLIGAAGDGTALYCYTKDGNDLYLHRFYPQKETVEENILGKAIKADEITAFVENRDVLVFAAGRYEGSANLFNGNFYACHMGTGKLTEVHLTDSEKFFVLGDRIYYEKFMHPEDGVRGVYSADLSLSDERKISENCTLLQTDAKKNALLVSEKGKLFYLSLDGKKLTEIFDLADAGWTWEENDVLYFREVSVLDDAIYVKAEKWSYVGDYGWRDSLTKSQYFQIQADGSGYTEWDPNDYFDKYYESLAFYDETLPGKPLSNPEKNGWNIKTAVDVRENFEQLPYEPDDKEKQQIYLIGQTERYTLYGKGDYESMLLEYDGSYAEIRYPYMSNYMVKPELWEVDADGDGRREAAICLDLQHGTGVSVNSFLMSDVWENGELYVYQFLTDDICEQLSEHLTYEITEEGCQPFVDGKKPGAAKVFGGYGAILLCRHW